MVERRVEVHVVGDLEGHAEEVVRGSLAVRHLAALPHPLARLPPRLRPGRHEEHSARARRTAGSSPRRSTTRPSTRAHTPPSRSTPQASVTTAAPARRRSSTGSRQLQLPKPDEERAVGAGAGRAAPASSSASTDSIAPDGAAVAARMLRKPCSPSWRTAWWRPAVALKGTPASRQAGDDERDLLHRGRDVAAAAELHAPAECRDGADRRGHAVAPAVVEYQLEVGLDVERLERRGTTRSSRPAWAAVRPARISIASTPAHARRRSAGVVGASQDDAQGRPLAQAAPVAGLSRARRSGRCIHACALSRAARSSASASSSDMLAGGKSAAWSIRRSSTGAQPRSTRLPGTMSSRPSDQRTHALWPPS